MSVMVLSEEKFVKLFNCLVYLEKGNSSNSEKIKDDVYEKWVEVIIEKNRNLVTYLYKMNVLNYCARYKDAVYFIDINLTYDAKADDSKDEILSILTSLRYNTCDYFETPEIDMIIKQIENNV